MNESVSRRPFRIQSDLREEDRPRWHVRTEDGQLRGPLSDHGLRALTEVGILTDQAEIRATDSEKFVSMHAHPIWPQIKIRKTELMLKSPFSLRESRPPAGDVVPLGGTKVPFPARENIFTTPAMADGPAFWSVRADYPSARDSLREVSTRARAHRARQEAQHVAKMAQIFAALRIAGVLRLLREVFVFALFLAMGDFVRRGFVEALGAARWLAVFGVVLLAMGYYLFAAFED
jgi:hypothetical protein